MDWDPVIPRASGPLGTHPGAAWQGLSPYGARPVGKHATLFLKREVSEQLFLCFCLSSFSASSSSLFWLSTQLKELLPRVPIYVAHLFSYFPGPLRMRLRVLKVEADCYGYTTA